MKWICLLLSLSCLACNETVRVAVQPLGPVDAAAIQAAASSLEAVYGVEVLILSAQPLPEDAFINSKSPRYRADKLIAWLRANKSDSADYIIGITTQDISTTKRDKLGRVLAPKWKYGDWGVMGLGYCPGASCVVSTFRLKTNNKTLFMERLKKVIVHELGHNLGLPHCPNAGCVMNDANESIKTIDKAKLELCAKCQEKI